MPFLSTSSLAENENVSTQVPDEEPHEPKVGNDLLFCSLTFRLNQMLAKLEPAFEMLINKGSSTTRICWILLSGLVNLYFSFC